MKSLALLPSFLFFTIIVHAQYFDRDITKSTTLQSFTKAILKNPSIDADSAYSLLQHWNKYPVITKTGKEYIYFYEDSFYGNVPLRIFIPSTYKNNERSSLILSLHGAVGASSFERVAITLQNTGPKNESDYDVFFDFLSKQNFIIVRPYADPSKKFDWVVNSFSNYDAAANDFSNATNFTFDVLVKIITDLKRFLNIDDSRIFSFGHSDGSDGAFALCMYEPSIFAGSVCYNSMLTNLKANNIYLRNTLNRPIYIVHSDLDNLRSIEQAREISKELKNINAPVQYKEYIGYKHFDKHLTKDLPEAMKFLDSNQRNPFQKNIYWETNDPHYNQCDWIRITGFNINLAAASWQKEVNVKSYNKVEGKFDDRNYYWLAKSCAIKAHYENNVFNIETSRVTGFEILINPKMVNLNLPVKVVVNGVQKFEKKINADKLFLLSQFEIDKDRQSLWITAIGLKP